MPILADTQPAQVDQVDFQKPGIALAFGLPVGSPFHLHQPPAPVQVQPEGLLVAHHPENIALKGLGPESYRMRVTPQGVDLITLTPNGCGFQGWRDSPAEDPSMPSSSNRDLPKSGHTEYVP